MALNLNENPIGSSVYLAGDDSNDPTTPENDEDKRSNILEIVRETLKRQNKGALLYRIVVCGRIRKEIESPADLGAHYQMIFKQYQNDNPNSITGLLLLNLNFFVHVIEASQSIAMSFLRDFKADDFNGGGRFVKEVKVLLLADDTSFRCFPFWTFRVVQSGKIDEAALDVDSSLFTEDALPKTITEMVCGLLKIGTQLSSLAKTDTKAALDDLSDKNRDAIPRIETTKGLIESEGVVGIEEWLQMFDEHVELVLEGERVWPCPRSALMA